MTTTEPIHFTGVDDRDVYNITAPFAYQGDTVIAGRVEKRDEELSEIVLFRQEGAVWNPVPGAPRFVGLQDPCVTRLNGALLLGGVRFPVTVGSEKNAWQMEFFLEQEDGSFTLLFVGPVKMKDIRFVPLDDGRLVVFTRPQGAKGGRGKIGYLVVDSLDDLTVEAIEAAPLLEGLCSDEQWVGANEGHVLSDGSIGVLGHIAWFGEEGDRHYYAMAFRLNLRTGKTTAPEIVAQRSDFPDGPSKRPDLVDVIFSGGLHRLPGGQARLFAGLSDAGAGQVTIADPFQVSINA